MVLNLGMLATYEDAKERLSLVTSTRNAWILASILSGGVASAMSLPFDNVKTKLQKQVRGPDGTFKYSGFMDCAYKTAANEGIKGFWAGFPTFVVRITPHVMIVRLNKDDNIYVDFSSVRVLKEFIQVNSITLCFNFILSGLLLFNLLNNLLYLISFILRRRN